MADNQPAPAPAPVNRTLLVAAAMEVGAILLAVAATALAAWRFVELSKLPEVGALLETAAIFVAAIAGSLLLWGMATFLRRLDALVGPAPVDAADAPSPAAADAALRTGGEARSTPPESISATSELVALMRDVRDIALLSDAERAQRVRLQSQELVRRLEQEVPALLREHNWVEAHRRVRSARERFPTLTAWDALEKQIEEARAGIEARDIEAVARQVNDLASVGAWERAADAVRDLIERHPGSVKAQELARRVAHERDRADAEQRAKMMAHAQEATNRREWIEALTAVTALIRKYPNSAEAAELRTQLPTLTANAEIQTRQRMEAEIRDLVKEHNFEEAGRIARALIERYPNSPQAAVLREQLPRLEQRATEAGRT